MLRAGAPDKMLYQCGGKEHQSEFEMIRHNNCNLRDIPIDIINKWTLNNEYIIPADEPDIKFVNEHDNEIKNQEYIMLPHSKNGHIMSYKHVPKDSDYYKNLFKNTGIHYPESVVYSAEEFEEYMKSGIELKECAIKSSTGSGSRGVYICSQYAVEQGWEGNYHSSAKYNDIKHIIDYTKKYRDTDGECSIKVEKLIPLNYHKITVDFIIRDGKCLAYEWPDTYPDNFTFFWASDVYKTDTTDKYMNRLCSYLSSLGITDGVLDFEGFMNEDCSEVWMCEMNWRWCGCYPDSLVWKDDKGEQFEWLKNYITKVPMHQPKGVHRIKRYWNTILEQNIPNYGNGWDQIKIKRTF